MLLLILILFGVLSVIALLIILWDYFKHGGAAVWDPEHPGRIITMKEPRPEGRNSPTKQNLL